MLNIASSNFVIPRGIVDHDASVDVVGLVWSMRAGACFHFDPRLRVLLNAHVMEQMHLIKYCRSSSKRICKRRKEHGSIEIEVEICLPRERKLPK